LDICLNTTLSDVSRKILLQEFLNSASDSLTMQPVHASPINGSQLCTNDGLPSCQLQLDTMPDAAPSVLTAVVPYVSVMPLIQLPGRQYTFSAVMGPDVSLASVKSNTLFVGLVAVVDEGGTP
jgi:hypothetical protein